MPELTAGDIGWLGAGWVFAWVLAALARLAAGGARGAAKPGCSRRPGAPPTRAVSRRGPLVLALLPAVPLALMVGGANDVSHAVVVSAAGALCGARLARRWGGRVSPRFVAAVGCVLGAAAVTGGFAFYLLMGCHGVLERGALCVAVSVGAWALAASASAGFGDFTRGRSNSDRRARRRPVRLAAVQSAFDDRLAYGLALALCAALAWGFAIADTSAQFRLAALIAACGLAGALGVRMIVDARFAATSRAPASGWRAVVARAGNGSFTCASLAGIPDELLVAACGGETFDAACLIPRDADHGNARDGSRHDAGSRRRRGRYGTAEMAAALKPRRAAGIHSQ